MYTLMVSHRTTVAQKLPLGNRFDRSFCRTGVRHVGLVVVADRFAREIVRFLTAF
jgi:hypothetical protein